MEKTVCPSCGSSAGTDKISKLYLETLGLLSDSKAGTPEALERHFGSRLTKQRRSERVAELRALLPLVSPPEGKKTTSRTIHPDITVVCFGLISILPLYGMKVTGSNQLLPSVLVLAAALGLYLVFRKKIIGRHERKVNAEREAAEKVRRGIENWMRLERCSSDGSVWDPASGRIYAEGPLAEQILSSE